MKFLWIIYVFIAISNAIKIRSSTESNSLDKTHTSTSESSDITQTITTKKRLMPKIQIKDKSEHNNNPTSEPTTRRPLMQNRKFISPPHAIHYIHSRTQGEQSNFSKRRNMTEKKRFRPHNNKPNSSEESSSVEDKFIHITDFDKTRGVGDQKRKVSSNRQLNRRRGHPLATAASEQFKSFAPYSSLNPNKYRSKSISAIQQSLQKIKSVRLGMKEKAITLNAILSKGVNDNKSIISRKSGENETTTETISKESISDAFTTELAQFMTVNDKMIHLPNTTENSIFSSTTGNNRNVSMIEMETAASSEKSSDTFKEIVNSGSNVTTSEKVDNTDIEKTNTYNLAATTSTDNSVITIRKFDNLVTKPELTDSSKAVSSATNISKPVGITIENSDESSAHTQRSVNFSGYSTIKTENPVYPGDKIQISDKTHPETLIPLIIVTSKSIPLSEINNNIEAITIGKNVISEQRHRSPKLDDEDIIIVTPISNDELGTTEGFGNHLKLRRKRHINIIQEEGVATTSTGYIFSKSETHLGADLTYRNIHT